MCVYIYLQILYPYITRIFPYPLEPSLTVPSASPFVARSAPAAPRWVPPRSRAGRGGPRACHGEMLISSWPIEIDGLPN